MFYATRVKFHMISPGISNIFNIWYNTFVIRKVRKNNTKDFRNMLHILTYCKTWI